MTNYQSKHVARILPGVIINTVVLTYNFLVLQIVTWHFVMPSFKIAASYLCVVTLRDGKLQIYSFL